MPRGSPRAVRAGNQSRPTSAPVARASHMLVPRVPAHRRPNTANRAAFTTPLDFLLDPTLASRLKQDRSGHKPTNYIKANKRHVHDVEKEQQYLKEQERLQHERASIKPPDPYAHVPSRLVSYLKKPMPVAPSAAPVLPMRSSRIRGRYGHNKYLDSVRPRWEAPSTEVEVESENSEQEPTLCEAGCSDPVARHTRIGEVPEYLVKRQEQWYMEEQRKLAAQKDPRMPPGYDEMPETERLSRLSHCERKYQRKLFELQQMPVACDTYRSRMRRSTLDDELADLEYKIRQLSMNKVFVRLDHGSPRGTSMQDRDSKEAVKRPPWIAI